MVACVRACVCGIGSETGSGGSGSGWGMHAQVPVVTRRIEGARGRLQGNGKILGGGGGGDLEVPRRRRLRRHAGEVWRMLGHPPPPPARLRRPNLFWRSTPSPAQQLDARQQQACEVHRPHKLQPSLPEETWQLRSEMQPEPVHKVVLKGQCSHLSAHGADLHRTQISLVSTCSGSRRRTGSADCAAIQEKLGLTGGPEHVSQLKPLIE